MIRRASTVCVMCQQYSHKHGKVQLTLLDQTYYRLFITLFYIIFIPIRGSTYVNQPRFYVLPNSGQGQPTRVTFMMSKIFYPKPASSSSTGCLASKILLLLVSRGSLSSCIWLQDSGSCLYINYNSITIAIGVLISRYRS